MEDSFHKRDCIEVHDAILERLDGGLFAYAKYHNKKKRLFEEYCLKKAKKRSLKKKIVSSPWRLILKARMIQNSKIRRAKELIKKILKKTPWRKTRTRTDDPKNLDYVEENIRKKNMEIIEDYVVEKMPWRPSKITSWRASSYLEHEMDILSIIEDDAVEENITKTKIIPERRRPKKKQNSTKTQLHEINPKKMNIAKTKDEDDFQQNNPTNENEDEDEDDESELMPPGMRNRIISELEDILEADESNDNFSDEMRGLLEESLKNLKDPEEEYYI